MINAGLGVAVGTAMYGLGMPNPVLWGVMAGCFNFIPYLGAITSAVVLTLVASVTFDQLAHIIVVPVVFAALTSLEGMIITRQYLASGYPLTQWPFLSGSSYGDGYGVFPAPCSLSPYWRSLKSCVTILLPWPRLVSFWAIRRRRHTPIPGRSGIDGRRSMCRT
jgi:hypothetical protein